MKKYFLLILIISLGLVDITAQDSEPEDDWAICQPEPSVYSLGILSEGYTFSAGLYTHCFCDGESYQPFNDYIEFEVPERMNISFSLYNSPQQITSFRIEEVSGVAFPYTYTLVSFKAVQKGRRETVNMFFNKGRYRVFASYSCGNNEIAGDSEDPDGGNNGEGVSEPEDPEEDMEMEGYAMFQTFSDMEYVGSTTPTPGIETTGMLTVSLRVGSSSLTENPGRDNPPEEAIDYQYINNTVDFEENRNFIIAVTPTVETKAVSYYKNSISTTNRNIADNDPLVSIQYFDGLGRIEQTVQRKITPDYNDIVGFVEYDDFNREYITRLPYLINANNGKYVNPATINPIQEIYGNDTRPYSTTFYEASPLNRMTRRLGPGAYWSVNSNFVGVEYLTNSGTSGDLACVLYLIDGYGLNTKVRRNGYYKDKQLYVTKMIDEEQSVSYEFKNVLGQVILTRQINYDQNNNKQLLDTYYVYDTFGNPAYVLPPLASDALSGNGIWDAADSEAIAAYAYIYKYDSGGNCVRKKLPGCDWIYYTYDSADQMIMTQTGEQRADGKNEALVTIPDIFGRVVMTGIYPAFSSSLFPGTVITAKIDRAASYSKFLYTGAYINDNLQVLTVNYYDSYEYLLLDEFQKLKYIEDGNYGYRYGNENNYVRHKGLPTGTIVSRLQNTGTPSYLYSSLYYDRRGRVIQTRSTNHLGGMDEDNIAYNFTGQPTKKMHVHTKDANGGGKLTEEYAYTYDHAGRLLTTTHQLTDGSTVKPQVTLAENTYDELGRLKTNTKGGVESTQATYDYNVRSWTKSITGVLFTENLQYGHTGNISQMQWIVDNQSRKYDFTYDNLSRLRAAAYTGIGSEQYGTAYSYDKHGNMLTLQRYGKTAASTYGLMDNLTMAYTGNQLIKAEDAAANISLAESADFKNYSNVATEYTYNANGSMKSDLNKGISDIQYNSLNLPRLMDIKSPVAEARNEYIYSAGGVKLKAVQRLNSGYSSNPLIGSTINTAALDITKTTDYAGNIIYENNSLKRILVDGGYIEGGVYYYYVNDHLGNNRVVVNANGTVTQKNHYYPFGMSFAENSVAEQGLQPYKYNNKELDQMHGLNLYDYGARHLTLDIPRFTTVDPLTEKYYSISPYAYVGNNPLKYVDPDGRDVWEINGQGEIVQRIEDKTQDAFYMVAQDADGNYQRTYTTDENGNKTYDSITFEYGTIESQTTTTYSLDGRSIDTYDVYQVRGDEKGTALFNFLGNNVTGSSSMVEIGQAKTGIEGANGLNFVTTGHQHRQEPGMSYLLAGQLYYGYTIRELNHSHPVNPTASLGDMQFKSQVTDVLRSQGLSIPQFNIFHIPSQQKIPY
ncbi:MAG: DUF6443 domain-containing protein [Prevotella sp.]|jgi:RHS repeat-associated protein|nr:DUF6443 domain-containing protein [Prevotella sp.]